MRGASGSDGRGAGRTLASVIKELQVAEAATEHNTTMTLNMCVNYGGRDELTDAIQSIAGEVAAGRLKPSGITEKVIQRHLYQPQLPDVDLFVRSSGEQRTSNFQLWQSAYAEMVFLDKPGPTSRAKTSGAPSTSTRSGAGASAARSTRRRRSSALAARFSRFLALRSQGTAVTRPRRAPVPAVGPRPRVGQEPAEAAQPAEVLELGGCSGFDCPRRGRRDHTSCQERGRACRCPAGTPRDLEKTGSTVMTTTTADMMKSMSMPTGMDMSAMQDCIEHQCSMCMQACMMCADQMAGMADIGRCAAMSAMCADVCDTMMRMMLRPMGMDMGADGVDAQRVHGHVRGVYGRVPDARGLERRLRDVRGRVRGVHRRLPHDDGLDGGRLSSSRAPIRRWPRCSGGRRRRASRTRSGARRSIRRAAQR